MCNGGVRVCVHMCIDIIDYVVYMIYDMCIHVCMCIIWDVYVCRFMLAICVHAMKNHAYINNFVVHSRSHKMQCVVTAY